MNKYLEKIAEKTDFTPVYRAALKDVAKEEVGKASIKGGAGGGIGGAVIGAALKRKLGTKFPAALVGGVGGLAVGSRAGESYGKKQFSKKLKTPQGKTDIAIKMNDKITRAIRRRQDIDRRRAYAKARKEG